MNLLALGIAAVERGLVPDPATRSAIRRLCRKRAQEAATGSGAAEAKTRSAFQESMRHGPIAPVPAKANEQHYELPPAFFQAVLGPHRKYSCCYWPEDRTTLDEAEAAALQLTCERAELANGQTILELGCGWGSLSLWMAERFPASRILAMSNSTPQRQFIAGEAGRRGLTNLSVVTADVNQFSPSLHAGFSRGFDRVVSIEMFEHLRNYAELLQRIATWLRAEGKLFVHIFCHRNLAYPYETEGEANWMGRHFFTGGIMPSFDLLRQFPTHLHVTREWDWNGRHYQRTAEAWLANLDSRRREILPILRAVYGSDARCWLQRWRVFFLAVAELFGYAGGAEWFVGHYLLEPVR